MEPFLRPNEPVQLEGRNFRRQFRERAAGAMYFIQIEVTEAFWNASATIPRDAIVKGALFWTDGDEQVAPAQESVPEPEPPQEKPKKGPHGEFWKLVRWAIASVDAVIRVDGEVKGWAYLREAFDTPSLSFISPEEAIDRAYREGWVGLHTACRSALASMEAFKRAESLPVE